MLSLDGRRLTNQPTVLQLITHLSDTYGQLDQEDLERNLTDLRKDWDSNTPIRTLWKHTTDCRAIAVLGNNPISETDAINACITTIDKSGAFPEDMRIWRRLPILQRDWNGLKTFFNQAERERNPNANATVR